MFLLRSSETLTSSPIGLRLWPPALCSSYVYIRLLWMLWLSTSSTHSQQSVACVLIVNVRSADSRRDLNAHDDLALGDHKDVLPVALGFSSRVIFSPDLDLL